MPIVGKCSAIGSAAETIGNREYPVFVSGLLPADNRLRTSADHHCRCRLNRGIFSNKNTLMATILIIDDSALIRNRMTGILQKMGFDTEQAVNGKDGLEKANTRAFDCIFTDLLMPEMDGFSFIEESKKRHPAVPIIVVSADIQKATRDRCLELGAAGILPKPPRPEDVEQILSTLL